MEILKGDYFVELNNGKKVNLNYMTTSELEEFTHFIVLDYMDKNSKTIENLEHKQDTDSIFCLIYNDLCNRDMMMGTLFASVLKNKYKIQIPIM